MTSDSREYRLDVNANTFSVHMGKLGYLGSDRSGAGTEFTGDVDIDKILNSSTAYLRRDSVLKQMWGCVSCRFIGTSRCPHGIEKGGSHANGICDFIIKFHRIHLRLMSSSKGMKLKRNMNILSLQSLFDKYSARLTDISSASGSLKLSRSELDLLKELSRVSNDLGKRYDKAIQQDDGVVVNTRSGISAGDLDKLALRFRSGETLGYSDKVIVIDDTVDSGGTDGVDDDTLASGLSDEHDEGDASGDDSDGSGGGGEEAERAEGVLGGDIGDGAGEREGGEGNVDRTRFRDRERKEESIRQMEEEETEEEGAPEDI